MISVFSIARSASKKEAQKPHVPLHESAVAHVGVDLVGQSVLVAFEFGDPLGRLAVEEDDDVVTGIVELADVFEGVRQRCRLFERTVDQKGIFHSW